MTIVGAGFGSWLTAIDTHYSRIGRRRLIVWGIGGVIVGVGAIVEYTPLYYVGFALAIAVLAERLVTKRPMRKDD